MSKYVGLAIAVFFVVQLLWRGFRKLSAIPGAPANLSTGIRRGNYFSTGFFFLLGPFLLLVAAQHIYKEVEYSQNWISANGFVTEHVQAGFYRGRPQYRTRFHFQTSAETGSIDHEVLNTETDRRPPDVGAPVQILYDPSNPDHAIIDSFRLRWFFPFVLSIVGSLLLFLAIGAYRYISRIQALSRLARPAPHTGPGEGQLIAVKRCFFLSSKRTPCFYLIVRYEDLSGRKHMAESEPIWDTHPDTWVKKEISVPL